MRTNCVPARPSVTRRALLGLLALCLASAGLARDGHAAPRQVTQTRDTKHWNLGKDALALDGYDPVAYFADGGGKPKKGAASLELVHQGVRYRFASEANRTLFQKDPARFEPAYGGWCAYAMAQKEKVEIDPESFLLQDGRLMLFYKGWFNDTRAKFQKDATALTKKADAKWAELLAPPKPK